MLIIATNTHFVFCKQIANCTQQKGYSQINISSLQFTIFSIHKNKKSLQHYTIILAHNQSRVHNAYNINININIK